MANRWILKSEPSTYSHGDLLRDRSTVWDGVRNAAALIHIRAMSRGDLAMIYHSGAEKAVIGLATVASDPYPDPTAGDPRWAVVKLAADRALAAPVALATIKADPAFADLGLVRISRLSVMPVSATQWRRILSLGER
ncbi:MAG: EVE domain-containing protein [Gemmatimonadota bacterium]|nr:EVE domain-containing protein [Gemmatimonadota bacterium]